MLVRSHRPSAVLSIFYLVFIPWMHTLVALQYALCGQKWLVELGLCVAQTEVPGLGLVHAGR